jgi:hypothetical protein
MPPCDGYGNNASNSSNAGFLYIPITVCAASSGYTACLCADIISIVAKQNCQYNVNFVNPDNEIHQTCRVTIWSRVNNHDYYSIRVTRIKCIPIPTRQDIIRNFSPVYTQPNSHRSLQPSRRCQQAAKTGHRLAQQLTVLQVADQTPFVEMGQHAADGRAAALPQFGHALLNRKGIADSDVAGDVLPQQVGAAFEK